MSNYKIEKNDLVFVEKKTRGRHTLPKADKDNYYLVVSYYTNNIGTTKYVVIDRSGKEHFTTDTCVRKSQNFILEDDSEWKSAKIAWMDKTYVPVFGIHTYDYVGMPYVSSRDGKSRLIKPLHDSKKDGIWINSSVVHDDDVKLFLSSSFPPDSSKKGKLSEAVTFRIPAWIAEKNGFFSVNKG